MPKLGQEPIRRAALVKATIDAVGEAGSLSVTVSQIAKRAGMSSALAHHYFGGKDQILHAGMREILRAFTAAVRAELATASTPRAKIDGILRASFDPACFEPNTVAAWLNFYVQAQTDPEAQRFLRIYQRRLHSNLLAHLRPISPAPEHHAHVIAALIDGVYLRQALREDAMGGAEAIAVLTHTVDRLLDSAT